MQMELAYLNIFRWSVDDNCKKNKNKNTRTKIFIDPNSFVRQESVIRGILFTCFKSCL